MSVDVTKLPSGLTVVTDTMPHLETAALGVWAGVGGRDEKPNEHGISHLLEHMAFKGTTKRSSREIGRASCRERVWRGVVAGGRKKNEEKPKGGAVRYLKAVADQGEMSKGNRVRQA